MSGCELSGYLIQDPVEFYILFSKLRSRIDQYGKKIKFMGTVRMVIGRKFLGRKVFQIQTLETYGSQVFTKGYFRDGLHLGVLVSKIGLWEFKLTINFEEGSGTSVCKEKTNESNKFPAPSQLMNRNR